MSFTSWFINPSFHTFSVFVRNVTACPLPDGPKGEICVSATQGLGIRDLQKQVESAVMKVTNQKLWKVVVATSSPALRCVNYAYTGLAVRL